MGALKHCSEILTEYLVQAGCDVEQRNNRNQTALFFALNSHHWNLLSHLRTRDITLRIVPGTASEDLLKERIKAKDRTFLKNLRQYSVEFDVGHVINFAASLGHMETVKFLMDEFKMEMNAVEKEGGFKVLCRCRRDS